MKSNSYKKDCLKDGELGNKKVKMKLKNSLKVVGLMLIISVFNGRGQSADQEKKGLQITCQEKFFTNADSISFGVNYINSGGDTLVLPTRYLYYFPYFKLKVDYVNFCCGIHAHENSSKSVVDNKRYCHLNSLDPSWYTFIYPYDTLKVSYSMSDISYFCFDPIKEGFKYTYHIELNIPESATTCSNVWTGKVLSTDGSFTIVSNW